MRVVILSVLIAFIVAFPAVAQQQSMPGWSDWKDRFLEGGRVVDDGNKRISHSEGQGYGMILAVAADDMAAFDAMWGWTQENLMVRSDHLSAWRWENGRGVTDKNNATDGDILIAWALLRASETWHRADLKRPAHRILDDILGEAVAGTALGPVLLPGAYGFESRNTVTVNMAYWVWPALEKFASVHDREAWRRVMATGALLVESGRFGDHRLPVDWLQIEGYRIAPAPDKEPVFGYEAVRIPLYAVWGQERAAARVVDALMPLHAFWSVRGAAAPATVNLETGRTAGYRLSRGGLAAANLLLGRPLPSPGGLETEDYYAATLLLLAQLAHKEDTSQ